MKVSSKIYNKGETYFCELQPAAIIQPVLKVVTDSRQNHVPLQRCHALTVDNTNLIEVTLELFNKLCRNRIDVKHCRKVFLDNGKIKVFHTVEHALEMHNLDLADVQDKSGEFTERNKAIFSGSNFDNLLLGASREGKIIFGNVDLELSFVPFGSLFDKLCEAKEAFVQASTLLSLSLLLLEFIHVVHVSAAFKVDVLGGDS